jgi:hypothetical protein
MSLRYSWRPALLALAVCVASCSPQRTGMQLLPEGSSLTRAVAGQWLFVSESAGSSSGAGTGEVEAYPPPAPYRDPIRITAGINEPYRIAVDSKNDLFVANLSGTITIYRYSDRFAQPVTLPSKLVFYTPTAFAIDRKDDLWVSIQNYTSGGGELVELAPPYAKVTRRIKKQGQFGQILAFDSHNDLVTATAAGLLIYRAPAYATPASIKLPADANVATLATGEEDQLFVSLDKGATQQAELLQYKIAKTDVKPVRALNVPLASALAFSADGKLYAASFERVFEIPAPYRRVIRLRRGPPGSDFRQMAVDGKGDVYAAPADLSALEYLMHPYKGNWQNLVLDDFPSDVIFGPQL